MKTIFAEYNPQRNSIAVSYTHLIVQNALLQTAYLGTVEVVQDMQFAKEHFEQ